MDCSDELEHLIKRKSELKKLSCDLTSFVDWFAENELQMTAKIDTAGLCSALVELEEVADHIQDAIEEIEL